MLPYPTPPKGGGLYVIWLSECDEPHYYGGRAVSFKRRWRTHLQRLQKGIHKNPRMQATFNKYGVFRPEVTRPFGCEVPVLAWGLGLERLAMLRYGIEDIRKLYLSDLDWLEETPLCL